MQTGCATFDFCGYPYPPYPPPPLPLAATARFCRHTLRTATTRPRASMKLLVLCAPMPMKHIFRYNFVLDRWRDRGGCAILVLGVVGK